METGKTVDPEFFGNRGNVHCRDLQTVGYDLSCLLRPGSYRKINPPAPHPFHNWLRAPQRRAPSAAEFDFRELANSAALFQERRSCLRNRERLAHG
jgi:hypothetical protein